MTAEAAAVLRATFPRSLAPDLDIVLARLPPSEWPGDLVGAPILIEGQEVRLHSRLYSPEPAANDIAGLTDRQLQILACLYSWHRDGYVRERWMAGLRGDEAWLPLAMLRLVGDYIEPIWEQALASIEAIPRARYLAFADDNPAFMTATRDRIVSYHRYVGRLRRDFVDNPAYRFMAELGLWESHQGRRLIDMAAARRERTPS